MFFSQFEPNVANTIGKGIVLPDLIDNAVVFGALSGVIAWNLMAWWAGIPSSSSHALVGGIVGAGITKEGTDAIVFSGLSKTLYAILGVDSAKRFSAVRWNVAGGIVLAWVITIPAAATLASMFYWLAVHL